jgi:putative DNA primase/helicase
MNRSPDHQRAFDDWRSRALQTDILAEAVSRGAKLKRSGREWIGACPSCGGVDRFSVNPQKRIFNCRGFGGGDVIKMVEHLDGVSFLTAVETLTGEAPPYGGHSKPLSAPEMAERDRRRSESEASQRQREALVRDYQHNTREEAGAIWNASGPIADTIAERYLAKRGLIEAVGAPMPFRFHPALPYPDKGRHPALVCRVDDVSGQLTAVWRIFLTPDGDKLRVANPKLGLGPAGGGAVRIGGVAPKIAIAEGLESALGYWLLTGRKYPCWASLSTSGMRAVELPLTVRSVIVAPDGDRPMRLRDSEYVPAIPAGRDAAHSLRVRLLGQGIACMVAPEPGVGTDYCDLWAAQAREVA